MVKPKMAIPGTLLLQASESRSFSSVQWGLPAAAQFILRKKRGEVPSFCVSIPLAIASKINFWLQAAKSSQEVYSALFCYLLPFSFPALATSLAPLSFRFVMRQKLAAGSTNSTATVR
jgi:hypothetical protein